MSTFRAALPTGMFYFFFRPGYGIMIAHSCNPERLPPLRPVSQGLYPQSTAWQVNAACAALPSLRSWYNDCTFVQSEAVPPLRPVSQGLYPQSTAWQVNAACAALPSLRSWYNDCTFVQSEAASPLRPVSQGYRDILTD